MRVGEEAFLRPALPAGRARQPDVGGGHRRSPRCSCAGSGGGERDTSVGTTRRVASVLLASTVSLGGSRALAAPEIVSDVWEKMGGGQADIYYPDLFEGCWQVGSTLVSVDAPKGIEYANDVDQIQQAIDNELNKTLSYEQCFVRNSRNKVVANRSYNTRKITEAILGPRDDMDINWQVDDPNILKIHLRGLDIFTRVTRRFSEINGRTLESSELFEQVFDRGLGNPKVKASRLYTKFKWRDLEETPEGQPQIIATQQLYNFITPIDSADPQLAFSNLSDPSSIFKYKMAFFKTSSAL